MYIHIPFTFDQQPTLHPAGASLSGHLPPICKNLEKNVKWERLIARLKFKKRNYNSKTLLGRVYIPDGPGWHCTWSWVPPEFLVPLKFAAYQYCWNLKKVLARKVALLLLVSQPHRLAMESEEQRTASKHQCRRWWWGKKSQNSRQGR